MYLSREIAQKYIFHIYKAWENLFTFLETIKGPERNFWNFIKFYKLITNQDICLQHWLGSFIQNIKWISFEFFIFTKGKSENSVEMKLKKKCFK